MTLLRLLFGIAVAHETLYEVTDVTPAAGLMTPDGQHTVWTDKVMVSEPGMHVRYFNVEVHRRIAGGSAQIIASFENIPEGRPSIHMADDGTIAITEHGVQIFRPGQVSLHMPAAFVVALRRDGIVVEESSKLVYRRLTHEVGQPVVLDSHYNRQRPRTVVLTEDTCVWTRDGNIIASPLVAGQKRVLAKAGSGKRERIVPDGVHGRWVFARQGLSVRLFHVDDGRELTLQLPPQWTVLHASPEGVVLWGSSAGHFLFWDPVTRERRDFAIDATWSSPVSVTATDGRRLVSVDKRVFALDLAAPPSLVSAARVNHTRATLAKLDASFETERDASNTKQTTRAIRDLTWPYSAEALPTLHRIILGFRNSNVASEAASRMSESTDPEARVLLLDALQRTDDNSKKARIINALAMAGQPADATVIAAHGLALGTVERGAPALGFLGNQDAIEALQAADNMTIRVQSQADRVHAAVALAISQIETRSELLRIFTDLR